MITMVLFYYIQTATTTVDLTESGESGSDFDVKIRITTKNADEVLNLCTVKAWVHLNWSKGHISGYGGYLEQAMNF